MIDSVDLFVIFDDIAYPTGRSWRNRNQVKTERGLRWVTVPVASETRHGTIEEALIAEATKPWRDEHRRVLQEALCCAPFFQDAMQIWEKGVGAGDSYLSVLNVRLIRLICEYLNIQTPITLSRQYQASGVKTDRLLDLCRKTGATTYLSGPTARGYINEQSFVKAGIGLEYKTYDYSPYPQQWGEFMGTVTVLDLIANCGARSREFLKSGTANESAVSLR